MLMAIQKVEEPKKGDSVLPESQSNALAFGKDRVPFFLAPLLFEGSRTLKMHSTWIYDQILAISKILKIEAISQKQPGMLEDMFRNPSAYTLNLKWIIYLHFLHL